jgi:hypothetical protein
MLEIKNILIIVISLFTLIINTSILLYFIYTIIKYKKPKKNINNYIDLENNREVDDDDLINDDYFHV